MTDDEAIKRFKTLYEMAVAWGREEADIYLHALQAIEGK